MAKESAEEALGFRVSRVTVKETEDGRPHRPRRQGQSAPDGSSGRARMKRKRKPDNRKRLPRVAIRTQSMAILVAALEVQIILGRVSPFVQQRVLEVIGKVKD